VLQPVQPILKMEHVLLNPLEGKADLGNQTLGDRVAQLFQLLLDVLVDLREGADRQPDGRESRVVWIPCRAA